MVGCLVQTNDEIIDTIPGIDIILGNVHKSRIVDYIEEYLEKENQLKTRRYLQC